MTGKSSMTYITTAPIFNITNLHKLPIKINYLNTPDFVLN